MVAARLRLGATSADAAAHARWARQLLWWLPFSPVVGFLLGSLLLSSSWPLWQVVPLAALLAAPFALGAVHAALAVQGHDHTMWPVLIVHAAMAVVAIVLPISESLTS